MSAISQLLSTEAMSETATSILNWLGSVFRPSKQDDTSNTDFSRYLRKSKSSTQTTPENEAKSIDAIAELSIMVKAENTADGTSARIVEIDPTMTIHASREGCSGCCSGSRITAHGSERRAVLNEAISRLENSWLGKELKVEENPNNADADINGMKVKFDTTEMRTKYAVPPELLTDLGNELQRIWTEWSERTYVDDKNTTCSLGRSKTEHDMLAIGEADLDGILPVFSAAGLDGDLKELNSLKKRGMLITDRDVKELGETWIFASFCPLDIDWDKKSSGST